MQELYAIHLQEAKQMGASEEGTMHSLAYVVTLFSIPILATIICFIVTRIWDE